MASTVSRRIFKIHSW